MEDDLIILNVEYLSNHLLDHTQISNLSFDDQPIFNKSQTSKKNILDVEAQASPSESKRVQAS